jgi:hypothetical protein
MSMDLLVDEQPDEVADLFEQLENAEEPMKSSLRTLILNALAERAANEHRELFYPTTR